MPFWSNSFFATFPAAVTESGNISDYLAEGEILEASITLPDSGDNRSNGRGMVCFGFQDALYALEAPAFDFHRLGMANLVIGIAQVQTESCILFQKFD